MIVTCERCATQFQLDDSRVPARGVRVRCSRCKNAFRVVPEAQRAAEQMAELSRRAREDSQEEITQDLEGDSRGSSKGDSRGNSRSRSGSRRSEGSSARAGDSAHGGTGSGLDTEESDWKFNEDVSAESEAPIRTREEPKPEPPPVRRGAEADDWFRGGSDAPLELDDRPWNASEEAAAAESQAEPDVEREPEPEAEAPPAPMAAAEPSLDRFVEPDEPAPHASAEAPVTDEFDSLPSFDSSEPSAPVAQAEKEPGSTDELSSDSWGQLFGEAARADAAEESAPVPSRKARRRRSLSLPSFGGVGAHVGRWLGHGAQALGWLVTIGLFGAGLYTGFATQVASQPAPAAEQVGGFELAALEGRFVENAVSGRLYVVSGRVRNPGSTVETFPGLEIELLDAAGLPLASERAPLHGPIPKWLLREAPVADVMALLPQVPPLRPGEERAVEGVFASLPADAASFRVVAPRAARSAGGPLPEVDLPK